MAVPQTAKENPGGFRFGVLIKYVIWISMDTLNNSNPNNRNKVLSVCEKKQTKRQLCKGSNLRTWGQLDIDLDFPRWSSLQNPVGCSFLYPRPNLWVQNWSEYFNRFCDLNIIWHWKTSQHFLMHSSFTPPKTKTPLDLKWPTCLKENVEICRSPQVNLIKTSRWKNWHGTNSVEGQSNPILVHREKWLTGHVGWGR